MQVFVFRLGEIVKSFHQQLENTKYRSDDGLPDRKGENSPLDVGTFPDVDEEMRDAGTSPDVEQQFKQLLHRFLFLLCSSLFFFCVQVTFFSIFFFIAQVSTHISSDG